MTRYSGVSMLAIATALAFGGQAWAQDDDADAVAEVVVTAQKRNESLLETPLTVNVVSGAQIEALNLTQFEDIARLAPGLDITNGDGRQQTVSLRGVKFDQDTGTTRTVDIYLNEVPLDPTQALQTTYDIGQIEVLRGPQGTLRGGTGPSGAILIGTRRADLNVVTGTLNVSETDERSTNLQAAVGVPLIEGKLGLRVAGVYDRNYGRGTSNPRTGEEDNGRTRSYRASMNWEPTDDLSFLLMYQNFWSRNVALRAVEGTGRYGVITAEDRIALADGSNAFVTDGEQVTLNAKWELPGHQLSYVGGYQDNNFNTERDLDLANGNLTNDDAPTVVAFIPPATLIFADQAGFQNYQKIDINSRQQTHELRFERTGDHFWIYRFGYYQNDTSTQADVSIDYSTTPSTTPGVCSPNTFFCLLISGAPTKSRNVGYFTTQTLNFTEADRLEVGLRYSESRTGATTTDATTGTVSYKHDFNDDLMVYGSYGRGYRPGGDSSVGAPTDVPASLFLYEPEKSDSFEVGVKGKLNDGRVLFTLSAFHQKLENYIGRVNNIACTGNPASGVGPNPGTVYATNDGLAPGAANSPCEGTGGINLTYNADAKISGAELELRATLAEGWTAQLAAAYADATYEDAAIPCNDYDGDGAPDQVGLPGVQAGKFVSLCQSSGAIAALPKWQVSVNSEYSFAAWEGAEGFVRGLATYRPEIVDSNSGITTESAFRMDLFAGVRLEELNAEVSLFARNLFDDTTTVPGGSTFSLFGTPTGYNLVDRDKGREIGVAVRYTFGG